MATETRSVASGFVTPEGYAAEQARKMESPRGSLVIAGCRSGGELAARMVARYRELSRQAGSEADLAFLPDVDGARFADTEVSVRLDRHVSGCDVYLVQCLYDPASGRSIDQNLLAFLVVARAFREHGAAHVTAVLPYLAYARQDKPTKWKREPTTARLVADLAVTAGIDRLVVWEPHAAQVRGFFGGLPVNVLDSLGLFAEEFRDLAGRDDVIAVAPDAGASKMVTHLGKMLDLKCAIASKFRPRPEEAVIQEVIGDFSGKRVALVVDDMLAGGGTLRALADSLRGHGIERVHVGVSHNLAVGDAAVHLAALHEHGRLGRFVTTNSIPQRPEIAALSFVEVHCLSESLARTVNRIHFARSVSEISDPRLA